MAYYSDDLIDEIISRADIVSIIDSYVPLKRRGTNYIGLCPFHKEKTPSFTVSPDKQIFKCFGCGQGGSVIQFISKIENLDFKETLEFLADKTNIDLSNYEVRGNFKSGENDKDLKEVIFNINRDTAKYFYEALLEEVKDKEGVLTKYLSKRRLDSKVIAKFGLGYGNKRGETLFTYLTRLGYEKQEIISSGVVSLNIKGNIYESFATRLIFPIFDTRDKVIAFGGRVLDNSLPKYVNSPENIVYHKGKNLYGLNVAKKENLNKIIIVEGYMDTVALQKNDITNVVASLGTSLTENQAKLVKKYTDTVVIAYDQDDAGKAATLRAIDILYKEGLKVKVLCLDHDDVKDPDEYINKYGTEKFKECVKKSKSYVEYKVDRLEEKLDRTNFDSKVEFLTGMARVLSEIENEIERDMYVEYMASKYRINKEVLIAEVTKKINKVKNNIIDNTNYINRKKQEGSLRRRQEKYVIALMLSNDKKIFREILDKFSENDFENEDLKQLYVDIKEIASNEDITKTNIVTKFSDEEKIKLLTEIMCVDISEFDKDKLMLDMSSSFKKYKYINRRQEILEQLKQEMSDDEKKLLEVELSQILRKISTLK